MPTNLQTTLYERPYYAGQERSDPPSWFRHTPPAQPGSPPAYPGTLNAAERAQVEKYLATPTNDTLLTLSLRLAIAMAVLYQTYFATPAYKAWADANRAARKAQWQQYCADALVANKATTSISADAAGVGASPPGATVPPTTDV